MFNFVLSVILLILHPPRLRKYALSPTRVSYFRIHRFTSSASSSTVMPYSTKSLGKTGSGFHFHSLSFTAVVGELHLDVALVVGSVVITVDDPDGIV